ncbi:hypothetical protein V6N13_034927 [Hibiscus sabdariffa]|uniref:Uncharacterized protein n=1 Tax=Hibiscus sabdariffa TaxID=183260 RepID=A0ABR2AGM0_9ROSI
MKGSGIIGSERAFSPIHLAKDIPSQGKRKQVRLGGVDDPVNLSFTPGEDGTINATSPIPGMYVEISSCQAYEGLLSPMVGSNSLVRGGDSCTIKINYVDRRTILPGVLCPSQLVKTSISISDMPHLVGPSNIAKDIPSQGKRKQVRLSSISPVLPSGNGGRYNIRFFLSSGKKGSRFTD